jgi:hypothetical protein
MQGVKYDAEKLRWDLLPMAPVEQVVGVLTYGAKKYDDENWRKVDNQRSRYYAAAMRHIVAWWLGERDDPESGFHHLAHAMCCLIFLMEGEHANTSD